MSNGVGLAPLKTREYVDLLKEWGFMETNHGGNHPMFLTPKGKRFPMSSPGKVTMAELRKAAKEVGVTRRQFMVGPPKKTRPIRTVVVEKLDQVDPPRQEQDRLVEEMNRLVDQAEQRAKEKENVAKVVEAEGRVIDRIRQVFIDNPDKEYMPSEIEQLAGISSPQSGNPILRLKQAGFITQEAKGKPYRLANAEAKAADQDRLARRERCKEQVRTEHRRRGTDKAKRNGYLSFDILHLMEDNPDRPMSIDMVTEKIGSLRSSTAAALLTMSRQGIIEQLGRGIYRFNSPQPPPGPDRFVSDETPQVSAHPDDQPIGLVPTELAQGSALRPRQPGDLGFGTTWPGGVAIRSTAHEALAAEARRNTEVMWEQLNELGDGRYLLRDDNGKLWIARMQEVNL